MNDVFPCLKIGSWVWRGLIRFWFNVFFQAHFLGGDVLFHQETGSGCLAFSDVGGSFSSLF